MGLKTRNSLRELAIFLLFSRQNYENHYDREVLIDSKEYTTMVRAVHEMKSKPSFSLYLSLSIPMAILFKSLKTCPVIRHGEIWLCLLFLDSRRMLVICACSIVRCCVIIGNLWSCVTIGNNFRFNLQGRLPWLEQLRWVFYCLLVIFMLIVFLN